MKNALIPHSSFLGYGLLIAITMGGSMAQAQSSPFDVDERQEQTRCAIDVRGKR